jgi:hypothetical protein
MSGIALVGGMGGTSKPWCEWPMAGKAGCTLGVMGLYAGATGDEEPSFEDEGCDEAAVGSDGGLGGLIVKGMDCALESDLPVSVASLSSNLSC